LEIGTLVLSTSPARGGEKGDGEVESWEFRASRIGSSWVSRSIFAGIGPLLSTFHFRLFTSENRLAQT